jgi:hypothetical protein
MDLKNFLPGQKKTEEYFWSLLIEPGWVQAGVWRISDNKVQVISMSPSSAWELDEELTSSIDACLSSAVQDFPEEVNAPTKTVFGVSSSWVSEGQIKEDYLAKIKRICSDLSLTPVGFVVLPEATAHYFKAEEGVPLNAIILGISKESLEISLFRLGNLVGISQVARSVSIVDDVSEGLARFVSNEAFPSRIILYDGREGELEEIRQDLIKANWEDYGKIKFLHTPKIELLDPERKVYAVSLAGGAELADVKEIVAPPKEEFPKTTKLVTEEESLENVTAPEDNLTPSDFGFSIDEDVAQGKGAGESKEQGISEDFAQPDAEPGPPQTVEERTIQTEQKARRRLIPSFGFLNNIKSALFDRIKNFKKPKTNISFVTKPLVAGIIFFVLIIAAGFSFWWFFPKAKIDIFISTKKLEDKITIFVDPAIGNPDFEKNTLPGEVVEISLSGDKTSTTTGTKTIGDKATGEITIYRAGSEIGLTVGTLIHGPGGLDFTLDSDVKVASGSPSTPGMTKTKVTAKDIGAQYNLASNTTFTIGNYSSGDMDAKNESAFSGGSSREINAVSKDDQTNLLDELTTELEEKAKQDLKQKLDETKILIEDSIESTVEKSDFNHKVDDEATSLKLVLTLDVKGVAVDKNSLVEMAKNLLTSRVPQGFVLKSEAIETDFQFIGEKDGVYEVAVLVKADLLPQVNPDEVVKNITGKYPDLAEEYLTKNIPGFVRAEIRFNKPRFPGRLGTLPRVSKHIDITISAEQ